MQKTLIAVVVLLIIGLGIYYVVKNVPAKQASTVQTTEETNQTNTQESEGELQITDIKEGTGKTAEKGKTVVVDYTGTLENGTKFDSSKDRGEPFTFTLGNGEVIEGWDKGVVGMKEGGERKLVIPASMAYGDQDLGVIPANSTLVFTIELHEVK